MEEEEERATRRRRKANGLQARTRHLIDVMGRLCVFSKNTLLKHVENDMTLRRINDVVAILLGAGFLAKGPPKKHFTFVGIEGTRRCLSGAAPVFENRIRYFGYKMLELLAQKASWTKYDLRTALERDAHGYPTRRTYDVVSVFLGAGLADKRENCIVSTVGVCRKVFTMSNEDAIAVLPELREHLISEFHY